MRVMKKVALLLTVLCLTGLIAVAGNGIELEEGKELYFRARTLYCNGEAPLEEVETILDSCNNILSALEDGFNRYYWLGRLRFLQGEVAEARADGEKSREAALLFEEAANLAEKAVKEKENSDAHRLLADSYMRLMRYKGVLFAITKGSQLLKILNKAVSLDVHNYEALNSLGIYYLNAPDIGGGDLDKGINALKQALESKDELDNYISYVWLAIAFDKKGDTRTARKYAKYASDIYPNGGMAKYLLSELDKQEGGY